MGDIWPFSAEHTGEYALLVAFILVAAHLLGPPVRYLLINHSASVKSFGGGLAVAYVFLKLIPEIDEAHEYLGDEIHFIILFSFLCLFAIESQLRTRAESDGTTEDAGSRGDAVFWLHIGVSWIYTWIALFALPAEVTSSVFLAVFGGLALGLHIIYKDYVLHTHHRVAFEGRGRYVLALAPLAGWVAHVLIQPSEMLFDVTIAILAGFLIQGVFREELPSLDQARLRWFILGALLFLVLVLITS